MPAARLIATCVARPRWRRPGFTRNPKKVMTGSTTQPVSRSSTTEAKLVGPAPESRDRRLTAQHVAADRGGQHVGHELAGHVVREQRPKRVCWPIAASTACHRAADSTMPASVSSIAPVSQKRGRPVPLGQVGALRVADLGEQEPQHHAAQREAEREHQPALRAPRVPGLSPASSSKASCTGSSPVGIGAGRGVDSPPVTGTVTGPPPPRGRFGICTIPELVFPPAARFDRGPAR